MTNPTKLSPLLLAAVLVLTPNVARADIFGADIPVLGGILVQATQTVASINEQLRTARESYEEFRRMAGYAEDAAQAFEEFSQLNAELMGGELGAMFDQAFPEIASIRADAQRLASGGRWAEANGDLRRMVQVCLRVGQCTSVREALSFQQTREALDSVFGAAPDRLLELQAVDSEAAVAIAASTAQDGRGAVVREYAAELMRQCQQRRSGSSPTAQAACTAAAAAAEIANLESNADLADAVSQGNRIQALQLALKSQDRKRELLEAQERRSLLLEGARQLAVPPPRVETEGFDVLQGVAP